MVVVEKVAAAEGRSEKEMGEGGGGVGRRRAPSVVGSLWPSSESLVGRLRVRVLACTRCAAHLRPKDEAA